MEELDTQIQEQLTLLNHLYEVAIDYMVGYSFQLLGALVVIIAGFFIARSVSRMVGKILTAKDVDVTLREFIASTVRTLVVLMFVVIAIQQLGINITPLIAAIGGLAVGLSLALQGPVSNYGAGLVIILTRMYRVGDTITCQGCSGLVETITLAATELRAEDGELIVIPNKQIMGEIHSNSETERMVSGQVGIAYNSNVENAISIIEQALASDDAVSKRADPEVGICNFGDSSIDIEYRYWTATGTYYPTIHRVNLAIFNAFKAGGVSIPFPQREVRMLENP